MKERLPESERAYLSSIAESPALKDRVRDLCNSGWSLAAIAEAFNPPKSRSSIRAWSVSKSPRTTHTHPPLPPSSSLSSSDKQIPTRGKVEPGRSDSAPDSASASGLTPKPKIRRRVYDPTQPRISPAHKKKISRLAPLARKYRARTSPNNTYARANAELTDLCKTLYYSGASVRELSITAGVTYRAMARRLGR